MFIIENQFLLIALSFLSGVFGTLLIARKPAGHRAWLLADLIWVVLGLFGAMGAIMAGVYKTDSSRLERQIDIAYAATSTFDQDAARFRLRNCGSPSAGDVAALCDRVEFLSGSTAKNSALPLFIAVTEKAAPLQGLHLIAGGGPKDEIDSELVDRADRYDPGELLAFSAFDEEINNSIKNLRATHPGIAGDYQVLAQSYEKLIEQVTKLGEEWQYLRERSYILHIQIIAICLAGFAAPFRLGKSISELRGKR
ncbi:MAG: hypothetical protein OXD29_03915 [Roseovarius sp.]|nr:hypothetical protein [Roseovarius sp.]MCY4207084.1 hypothetical protein [Roseovarius sp.]MCY4292863.1 hypothetical protein [Roseovarius sp.]MCY4314609.1 hypothetical protein [Roseovarius sp.]